MKKGLAIASGIFGLCTLFAKAAENTDWSSDVSASIDVEFQTEHADRGRQDGKMSIVPKLRVGYDVTNDWQVYAGVDGMFSAKKKHYGAKTGWDRMGISQNEWNGMINKYYDDSRVIKYSHENNVYDDEKYNSEVVKLLSDFRAKTGFELDDKNIGNASISDNQRFDLRYFDRIVPYVGAKYNINEIFALDCGYRHGFYTKELDKEYKELIKSVIGKEPKRDNNEMYVGAVVNYAINPNVTIDPKFYITYGVEDKDVNIEGRISSFIDLSEHVISGLGLDIGAKIGFENRKKFWKIDMDRNLVNCTMASKDSDKNYVYYGVNAGVIYRFYENRVGLKISVEYVGNSAKDNSWANLYDSVHKNIFSFNAGAVFSF